MLTRLEPSHVIHKKLRTDPPTPMPVDDGLTPCAVLVCVTEHLSVGDVFRLRAAFGARDWPKESSWRVASVVVVDSELLTF